MSQEPSYQVMCADCLTNYGGFETKREAREWLIEHEAFHAGENESMKDFPPATDQERA